MSKGTRFLKDVTRGGRVQGVGGRQISEILQGVRCGLFINERQK